MPLAAAQDLQFPRAGAGDGSLHLAPLITRVADDALDEREAARPLPEAPRRVVRCSVASFLFCVLPEEQQEPVLREIARVLKPGGTLRLLEYVRPTGAVRAFVARPWEP